MKPHFTQLPVPPVSDSDFLIALGRQLLPYFPLPQTIEVLEDYEEYLLWKREEECGECAQTKPSTPVRLWESPKQIALALRREQPQSSSYFCRHTVVWGILLLALISLFYATFSTPHVSFGFFCFLAAAPISVFSLLCGRGRLVVERRFSAAPPHAKQTVAFHLIFFVIAALAETSMQCLLQNSDFLLAYLPPASVGATVDTIFVFFLLLTAALLSWALRCSATFSIYAFPTAVHALGTLLFLADIRRILHSMALPVISPSWEFALSLRFYAMGLLLSLLFYLFLRYFGPKSDHLPNTSSFVSPGSSGSSGSSGLSPVSER